MQFTDNNFRHDDLIASSFRTPSSHKADKVAELAEEVCHECFDSNFTNMFSSSAHDLAASAASKELNVDKLECYVHQNDKVGASSVGEITRTKGKAKLQLIPVEYNSLCLHLTPIDFIALLLGCDKYFS